MQTRVRPRHQAPSNIYTIIGRTHVAGWRLNRRGAKSNFYIIPCILRMRLCRNVIQSPYRNKRRTGEPVSLRLMVGAT